MDTQTIAIIAGIVIPIVGAVVGLIWRRIHHLDRANSEAHREIHGKIDRVHDKVLDVWKHLTKQK